MSRLERQLVRKLDCFILVYCCAAYFFNYLDRSAFANAYVSGLKESLNLHGNQYSVLLSMFTAGNVVGQIPHALIIQKITPRLWLPTTLIIWSGLTMCSAACKTYEQLCVVRFFQGLMESSLYSGTIYVLGSCKPIEIAKRTAIFTAIGQIGSMFAGIMMTAMNESLHNRSSLEGWQWVFIIDGAMGIPFGIFGLLFFPNLPESGKVAPYMSKEEIQLALDRLPPKREDGHNINVISLSKRLFLSPTIYILTAYSIIGCALEAYVVQGLFLLWMKSHADRFPSRAITTYPLGIQAVAIVSNIGAGYIIDMTNRRIPMAILASFLQLIVAIMLIIPSLPQTGTFIAFYLSGTSYIVNPILYGWASIICQRSGDDATRSVILYVMSMSQAILYTFWGIALYPADDAPYWRNGAIAMIVVVFAFLGATAAMEWLDRRSLRVDQGDGDRDRFGVRRVAEDVEKRD